MVKMCSKCKIDNTTWGGLCKCGYYPFIKDDIFVCPNINCKSQLVNTDISDDDLLTICDISEDPNFIEAMIDLKEKDIIEYESKMTQFKSQISQQKNVKEDTKPKCPYCQSNNIKKISTISKVVNTTVWGIFGTKRHKQWHCNNCKSDF